MFLVTGLAKLKEQDAAAVDALEVLKMATVNGAKAMSLLDTDVLAAGKQADVIMIDLHQPNMQPLNHIPKNIVYSGSKQNVKMTMIRGRILYENGQFANQIDEKEIYGKANADNRQSQIKAGEEFQICFANHSHAGECLKYGIFRFDFDSLEAKWTLLFLYV